MSNFARFKAAFERFQRRLGLTDWRVTFKTEKMEAHYGACIQTSVEARHAVVKYNTRRETEHTVEGLARHECLHLLFTDMMATAALRADRHHADAQLEEHRVIERLLAAMGKP